MKTVIEQQQLIIIDGLREKIAKLERGLAETERKWRDERDLRIVAEEKQCRCDIPEDNHENYNGSVTIPDEGQVVAVYYRDNFDGEGDVDFQLAYIKGDTWYEYHDGMPLIEYVGDVILEWWPLVHGSGIKP